MEMFSEGASLSLESAVMIQSILSDSEKLVLEQFREKCQEYLPQSQLNNDAFLLRWLTAREFDIEKSFLMLSKNLEWKAANDLNSILDWEPPNDLKEACPYEITGFDKFDRPVLYFPFAKWASWKFTNPDRREEYIRYMIQMVEKCVSLIKQEVHVPPKGFVIIADSNGFGFGHMTRVRALETNIEVVRIFEANYPEFLAYAFAINCPKVFSILYSLIKPILSERTQEKLCIQGHDKSLWMKSLTSQIPQENIPKILRSQE